MAPSGSERLGTMRNPKRTAWIALALLLPFAGLLIWHASYYFPFISDDALISLRYADRLLEGHGLTWSDGRPVEGYSNLLWILLVAFLGMFRVDLIDAARILGVLGTIVIMFSISYWYTSRNVLRAAWVPIAVALLFLSLGAPLAVWAIGGMEQPLHGALIAVSIPLMYSIIESNDSERQTIVWLSVVQGLMCLTRPDGPIFAVAAAASLLLAGWFRNRHQAVSNSLLVLLFPALFYAGQLVFRLCYYGELLPNTALVKLAPSSVHSVGGLRYLSDGLQALAPLSVLGVVCLFGLLASSRTRARAVYLLAMAVMWSAYVVVIGGDVFPAYRHLVPLMVVFAFALAEGFSIAVTRLLERPRYLYPFILLTFVLFLPYTYRQFTNKHNQRAVRERWEWQGREVGLLLKTAFWTQQPLLAVTAAGCLPYWSQLPALDMLGLNDYYLPRHRPADFGKGWVGHELGDGRYVLSRTPDMIVFSVGSEPAYRSGQELDAMTVFHDRYAPVTVRTYPKRYDAIIYFDKYSHKIGIKRSESTIVVPGFLFVGEGTVAYLNKANKLVVQVANERPVHVRFDSDPQQRWVVQVNASDPDDITSELKQDGASLSVTLSSRRAEPIEIEEVVLRTAPGGAGTAGAAVDGHSAAPSSGR